MPLILQQLPRRALHPQLRIPPLRELKIPGQRLRLLTVLRRINKVRFQMKRRFLLLIVRANFH